MPEEDKLINIGDIVYADRIGYFSSDHQTRKARVTGVNGSGIAIKYWDWNKPGFCRDVVSTNRLIKIRESYMKLSKPAVITGVVLGAVLIIGMWLAGNYNSLVIAREDVDNSWSKVETQYQRRFDLIGNLVESVKGSQAQESKVFKDIADARKQYQASSGNADQQAQAASSIETNVALIPRLQEAYPELKSNQNVQSLMKELQGTEGSVATKRDAYNDVVTNYNKNVQSFPKSIFAGIFGFDTREQFKSDLGANKAPKVDF